ncbi:MAG: MauE/DoxX family redox-associated membrane protein [Thermoanaerobaculaceae bacterium]
MTWVRAVWFQRVLSWGLGAIFLYAALAKVLDPRPLITIIWGYRILPPGPINLVAIYMPWLELAVALGLITGFFRKGAAFWAFVLLTLFEGALLVNAFRGVNVACGCFSQSAEDVQNAWLLVLRDLPMWLAAAFLLVAPRKAATSAK